MTLRKLPSHFMNCTATYFLSNRTAFYLTKEQYFREFSKSELAQEIRKLLPERCLETVPVSNIKAISVFEFMGHCHKVPIKTLKMRNL